MLNYHIQGKDWLPYITTLSVSTSIGWILGGPLGAILGLSTSMLDEYINNNNQYQIIDNKHYIARSIFYGVMLMKGGANLARINLDIANVHLDFKYKFLHLYLSAFAPIISYFSDDFLDYKLRATILYDAFFLINKLFDTSEILSSKELVKIYSKLLENPTEGFSLIKGDIDILLHNPFLVNFIQLNSLALLNTVIDYKFLGYIGIYGQGLFITNVLLMHQLDNFNVILKEGSKIAGIFLIKNVLNVTIEMLSTYLEENQFRTIFRQSTKTLLDTDIRKKLNISDKELIKSLDEDLYIILQTGVLELNSQINTILKMFVSLGYISNIMPEAIIPGLLTFLPEQILLTQYILIDYKMKNEERYKINSKIWQIKFHISENINSINLRDANKFIEYKFNQYITQMTLLNTDIKYLENIETGTRKMFDTFDMWTDIIFWGFNFVNVNKKIQLAQIPLMKTSVSDFFSFLSDGNHFQKTNINFFLAKERIEKFFSMNLQHTVAVHTTNDEEKIILEKYTLMLDEKLLFKINYLEFQAGKHYAITGKSGCGKTSMLMDLKEGLSGALSSFGTISLPDNINGNQMKLMFIDQNVYIPLDSTLLEIAYFPGILGALTLEQRMEVREQIIALCKELSIDEFINESNNDKGLISRLDSKEFKLSGGQSKKIAVIQAIMNKPNILIADELTSGLDKSSLIKVEYMLTKYLPNITILSVEHHAEDNNYNNFYDFEVDFSKEQEISIQDIISKQSDIPIEGIEIKNSNYNICFKEEAILLYFSEICDTENNYVVV